jgi:hypothetical protein
MTQPSGADEPGQPERPDGEQRSQADEAELARAHEEWAAADALLEGQPTELGE